MFTKHTLFGVLLTRDSLATAEAARKLAESFRTAGPTIVPQRFGTHEPAPLKYDTKNEDAFLECWSSHAVLWERKRPSVSGMRANPFPGRKQHASLFLEAEQSASSAEFAAVIEAWAVGFAPDFAFVHELVAPADIERGSASRTVGALNPGRTRFTMLVFTDRLEEGIPELYWRTYFGPAYIKHFGRERLLSTPAARVVPVGETILVQLTDDIGALRDDFASVEQVRARVREHLGPESFFDPARGVGARVPDFGLPVTPIPGRIPH